MPILAEDVETEVQLALLAREGCQASQGLSDRTADAGGGAVSERVQAGRRAKGDLSRLREACCPAKPPPAKLTFPVLHLTLVPFGQCRSESMPSATPASSSSRPV